VRNVIDGEGRMTKEWYPGIDLEKCIGCLECLNFCPNGVFELGPDGKPRVAHPEKCVDSCKACAKICEQGAIVFAMEEKRGKK